jgi:hypothetical protein
MPAAWIQLRAVEYLICVFLPRKAGCHRVGDSWSAPVCYRWRSASVRIRIHIVGDTQRIMPVEQLVFGRETNDAGRSAVAQDLLAGQSDAIVHLGDLVGNVGSAVDWARFDRDYPPSALAKTALHVCRGNHDCGGLLMGHPREFERRYPRTLGQLQSIDLRCVRLLLLDTNRRVLSSNEWQAQRQAFQAALMGAERDATIDHVLAFGHHPPLTNGLRHHPDRGVYDAFVEPFLNCSKTRAFFSGHVHAYERFDVQGRYLIVTGGGGGPRARCRRGRWQRYKSEVELTHPHPLHYVRLEATPNRIVAVVRCRSEESGNWKELDQWSIEKVNG